MFHYILFVIKGLKWLKFKEFQKYGNTNSCITCDQFLFFLKKSFSQMKEGKYVFHYLCKACINVVIILIISKAPCICCFKFVSQTKDICKLCKYEYIFLCFSMYTFLFFSIIMQAYLYFHVIRYFLLIAAFLYHILVYKNDE